MKIIYVCFVFYILTSCSKDYLFNRDQVKIANQLNNIKDTDQGIREFNTLLQSKFKLRTMYTVFDSLDMAGVSEEDIVKYDISKIKPIQIQIDQLPAAQKNEYNLLNRRQQKIWSFIDSTNAVTLFHILKKYGYPSYDNRKWTKTSKTGIAFVMSHIDSKSVLGKKIVKLMFLEYRKKRVEEGEMQHYLWSIDGRKGFPYDYIIDVEKWNEKISKL